jgi:tetratricopeptide (TPR) repeat protein
MRVLIGYYVTLALLVVGAFLPDGRVWGINGFSYLPIWAWSLIATTLAILPLVIDKIPLGKSGPTTAGRFWVSGVIGAAICVAIFALCANRTHFLGDGIQILHNLRTGTVTHMIWNVPAEQIQAAVFELVGGKSEADALLVLRLISFAAGAATILLLLWSGRRLGLGIFDSWLWCIGVLSSGIGMFFFGYVETYPPFIFAVIGIFVFGLLALAGHANRWWAAAIWLFALALHLFAIAFLPAILYLLVQPTPLWTRIVRWPAVIRYGLLAVAAVAGGAAIAYAAGHDYEIRFMLVPPTADRFTVEGYTLFSLNHLSDLANLALLLLPAIIVFMFARAGAGRQKSGVMSPAAAFHLTAVLGAGALVFVFDPKLGMLRDWDLFAFASIPVLIYCLYYWLVEGQDNRAGVVVVILAVALNLAVLIPRVATAMSHEKSTDMVYRIFELDRSKTRSLHYLMVDYLRKQGLKTQADSLQQATFQTYPEIKLQEKAAKIYEAGMDNESIVLARQVITLNPTFVDPYSLLCAAYSSNGQLAPALEYGRIAFGLNPRNAAIAYNMANVHARLGDIEESRKYLQSALTFEPEHQASLYGMASIAVARRDLVDLRKWVTRLPVNDSVDASKFGDLVISACARKMFDEAAGLLRFGIEHKLDTSALAELLRRYPELQARMK